MKNKIQKILNDKSFSSIEKKQLDGTFIENVDTIDLNSFKESFELNNEILVRCETEYFVIKI